MNRLFGAMIVVCSVSGAQAGVDMDHVYGGRLQATNAFSPNQIFPDFPDFSSMVVDDFRASQGRIDKVAIAYYYASQEFPSITGYQVSVWKSLGDAATSGNWMNQKTVGEVFLTPDQVTRTTIGRMIRAEMNVNINVTPGEVYYLGIAPIATFNPNGAQVFIGFNNEPPILGNGTATDGMGVNPGNGYGLGNIIPTGDNAALYVRTVPEPSVLAAVSVFLALKRRKRKH